MSSPADRAPAPQPETFAFTAANVEKAKTIIAAYPAGRQASAILPLLDLAQRQHGGWLPQAAIEHIAEFLGVAKMRVTECATFYTMFNLRPVGRHHVQLCTNISCWLRGADTIADACRDELGIGFGESTSDGAFSLSEVECLGACVNAPMMQIGDDYFEDLDSESTRAILRAIKDGRPPKPGPQNGRASCEPLGGPTTLLGDGAGAKPGGDD